MQKIASWLAVVFLLLVLFGAEIFLRLRHTTGALPPSYAYLDINKRVPVYEAHPFLPFTGRANDKRVSPWKVAFLDELTEFTLKYHTNSHGFLGDDFEFEKRPGEIRILTFGGSTTWAMGMDRVTRVGEETNTWPYILQRKLTLRFPQYKFTVYNLAQNAFSSAMSVVNLAFVGVNLHPDFVLSYDGINDMALTFDFEIRIDYANRFSHYNRYRSIGLSWPRFVFRSRLVCWLVNRTDRIIGYGASTDALASVLPPPRPNAFRGSFWNSATLKNINLLERNLKTMKGICKQYDAVFIGATLHYFTRDKLRDDLNQSLRNFYDREDILYFDADRLIPKGDKTINVDEVHFTKEGTELMAEGFAEVVSLQIHR